MTLANLNPDPEDAISVPVGGTRWRVSDCDEWKRLALDMGEALRQIEQLVNHEYRLKHHDLAFVFNTIAQVVDGDDVPALLARLDGIASKDKTT